MTPIVQYDPAANAAYIRFSLDEISESEEVSAGFVLDFDAEGRLVGMEVRDEDKTRVPPSPKPSPRLRSGRAGLLPGDSSGRFVTMPISQGLRRRRAMVEPSR